MMLCSALRSLIQSWLRDYDKIQSFAVILIYVQIGCALVGSLGALYNGVLLINLAIALFALVAIESSSQSLARTYAVLLFCAILLDIFWFILFTHEIWNISSEIYGTFAIFSVKLTFSVQIIGFFVRFLSSFLWVQMYRLGVSYVDSSAHREADFDMRNSFLSPSTPAIVRHSSGCDDALGGSIYDPVYYSSLFEDGQDNGYLYGGHNYGIGQGGSMSSAEASQLKPSLGRSSQVMNIQTKKRNRLAQKRLNDLVFVKYKRALRHKYNSRDTIDPITLTDIDESNEWLVGRIEEELVFEDGTLTWDDVARAAGVEEASQ